MQKEDEELLAEVFPYFLCFTLCVAGGIYEIFHVSSFAVGYIVIGFCFYGATFSCDKIIELANEISKRENNGKKTS